MSIESFKKVRNFISVHLSAFLNWVFSFIKRVSPHRKMLQISMPGQYTLLEGHVLGTRD